MKTVNGDQLEKGQTVIAEHGLRFKITDVKPGDLSPMGKLGKFWHSKPITVYFIDQDGEKGYSVIAPSDMFNIEEIA